MTDDEIRKLAATFDAMSPEEKEAMHQKQRESWVRAMAPCEHGDPDWETCPQCREGYAP